ncbi:serine hydrolase [Streptomyces eurocidicus]|uniref:CubicO group peptidase (Beta-lactamase class C family) n=1 Tax=Streptomyces eurocidicus TaxID=66423 RepID=A0A7W8BJ84_STREU|nr:CubicO group peptidase (beta-lactamase class C family) [Streptomyces eurocidicus]
MSRRGRGFVYVTHLADARYYAPGGLVGTALRHKAEFDPGKGWKYSNTNYVLAGLIVQKVTGRSFAEEVAPSWGWAAGQMVSTGSGLNRFRTALPAGDLLPEARLDRMRTTVPAGYFGPGARYGPGLVSTPLSCGGVAWGHGGSIPGYETRGGAAIEGAPPMSP